MHQHDEQQRFDARAEDCNGGSSSRYNNEDEEDCAQARDNRNGDKSEAGLVPLLTMNKLCKD